MTDKYKRMDHRDRVDNRNLHSGRRCLITGCAGFVGRHVARRFGEAGHHVAGIGRGDSPGVEWGVAEFLSSQISDEAMREAFRRFRPAVCIHTAGSASVAQSFADPEADYQGNIPIWRAVLEAAATEQPSCHLVLVSSAAVYGPWRGGPILETAPCRPASPYGAHKLACEQLADDYRGSRGLRVSVARVFNVYGPYLRRQVLAEWCDRAMCSPDGTVRALGSGDETRDFIHADDAAEALRRIADAPAVGPGVFNVGSGQAVRIRELADRFQTAWPQPVSVQFEPAARIADGGAMMADIGRLQRLGFEPAVSLADGVRKYVAWFTRQAGTQLRRHARSPAV